MNSQAKQSHEPNGVNEFDQNFLFGFKSVEFKSSIEVIKIWDVFEHFPNAKLRSSELRIQLTTRLPKSYHIWKIFQPLKL